MRFTSAWALPTLLSTASARFVMYADQWHTTRPTNADDRAGIDHVILAFAAANNTAAYSPYVPISTIRSEFPNAKVLIAVGGWGDDVGFNTVSQSDSSIQQFASDVNTMLTNTGADGVDIDWEYPGGNGADYKQVSNEEKAYQIEAFPKVLAATRTAIGPNKLLSIAVPGKKGDMIAFTPETGPKIWPSVDHVNIMSYDLMNRRDNITAHHTSVTGSLDSVKNYLAIGAPAEKINLGFAYYAKYFTTAGDCSAAPLGCPIVPAEDPVTGKDTLTSGAWTFERQHMAPVDASSLTISTDGTCGPEKGTKCASGCCSQYGNCGTSPEHCSGACQHAFGTGCTDADVAGSWQNAAKGGVTDEEAGGQYYYDATNGLFWTWDTPDLISRKFHDIVHEYGLGGVMAWSLGEDSYDWSHVRRMAEELEKSPETPEAPESDMPSPPKPTYQPPRESYKPQPPAESYKPQPPRESYKPRPPRPSYAPTYPSPSSNNDDWRSLPGNPSLESDPNLPYDVVWVDGTTDGPEGEWESTPGAPEDYSVVWSGKSRYGEEDSGYGNGGYTDDEAHEQEEEKPWASTSPPSSPPVDAPADGSLAPGALDDGSWRPGKYDRTAVLPEAGRLPSTTEQLASYNPVPAPAPHYPQPVQDSSDDGEEYEQVCTLRRVRRKKRGLGRRT
ncbi:Chitinase 1-like protein 1 [Stagonosporopsis vannaccii]|nr:Chitinase 1-like protein 1 [Stagonosporopsis vannaccii]